MIYETESTAVESLPKSSGKSPSGVKLLKLFTLSGDLRILPQWRIAHAEARAHVFGK